MPHRFLSKSERALVEEVKDELVERGVGRPISGPIALAMLRKEGLIGGPQRRSLDTIIQLAYLQVNGWRCIDGLFYHVLEPSDPSRHSGWSLSAAVDIQCRIDQAREPFKRGLAPFDADGMLIA